MSEQKIEAVFLAKRAEDEEVVSESCFQCVTLDRLTSPSTDESRTVLRTAEGKLETSPPPHEKSGLLLELLHLSVDPYLRCQFNSNTGVDYVKPFEIGEPIQSSGVVKVHFLGSDLAGKVAAQGLVDGGLAVGDMMVPWQNCLYLEGDVAEGFLKQLRPLPPTLTAATAGVALGALGITGLTAYFGVIAHGEVKTDEVLVVSSAAGATGSAACQIAKALGAKVIGLTSTDAKVKFLKEEVGADVALNYKELLKAGGVASLRDAVLSAAQELQPSSSSAGGVDAYFDNAGGPISDAVISTMRPKGRIILCGQIAAYNDTTVYPPPLPEETQEQLRAKAIVRERYLVLKYQDRFMEAIGAMMAWIGEGKFKIHEDVRVGLFNAPAAFVGLMAGENLGKMVVRI